MKPTKEGSNHSRYSVICHNGSAIVAGSFLAVTDLGCEIQEDGDSGMPRFALRSQVVLNILDIKKGMTMNVRAMAADVTRRDGAWIYRLLWDKSPGIFPEKRKKRAT